MLASINQTKFPSGITESAFSTKYNREIINKSRVISLSFIKAPKHLTISLCLHTS